MGHEQGRAAIDIDIVLNPIDVDTATLLDAARAAEAAGFGGVWTYDHLSGVVLHGRRALDLWTLLGALATATTRLALGPLVANATVRHPARLNAAVSTLQELSGGRCHLGLGAGAGPGQSFARELTMLGLEVHPAATRRQMVADAAGYLRALWSGAPAFSGHAVSFADVEGVLVPTPTPKIIVGANGPKMATLAGEVADGLNVHDFADDLPGLLKLATDAARSVGNDGFLLTVEGPFEDRWLDVSGAVQAELAALGVTRVMLRWSAELGVAAIDRAARLIAQP